MSTLFTAEVGSNTLRKLEVNEASDLCSSLLFMSVVHFQLASFDIVSCAAPKLCYNRASQILSFYRLLRHCNTA